MRQISWFFQNLSARIRKDPSFARRFFVGCVIVVIVIVAVVALASCGKDKEGEDGDKPSDSGATTTTEEVSYTAPTMEEAPLEEDAHADVNTLMSQYLAAVSAGDTAAVSNYKQPIRQDEILKIQIEADYLEEFDNVKVYTKPGPLANTYVAFVYYEIKFKDIDRMAPGLTTNYIVPKADGSLCIFGGEMDPRVNDYIKEIIAHDDVKELYSTVNTRYAEAISESNPLKTFMEVFTSDVEKQVSEEMAKIKDGESTGDAGDSAAAAPSEQICTAIETVNVRASDSENGEKLGKLQQGEKVTRYEEQENGWSRVSYNGSEAYVKSEYLKPDEAPAAGESEGGETAQSEGGETAQTTESAPTDVSSLVGKDTVTAKESVNVRKSASQDSDKIGVAYQGEHFKLLQAQSDGWCKIEFNGQTGFVKAEFVE